MLVALIIAVILLIISITVIINLLAKVEKLEDAYNEEADKREKLENLYINLKYLVGESELKLEEIDHRGSFSSDDEIGWFFENVKEIQNRINKFFGIKRTPKVP